MKNDNLSITDLSKLEITKVKDIWAVYFDYDNEKYLLHESYDDESITTLFKRMPLNEKGKYKLEHIHSEYGCIYCIKAKNGKTWSTYNQIDKEYFVRGLTIRGFIDSLYSEHINATKSKINAVNEKIKKLEEQRRILDEEMRSGKEGDIK